MKACCTYYECSFNQCLETLSDGILKGRADFYESVQSVLNTTICFYGMAYKGNQSPERTFASTTNFGWSQCTVKDFFSNLPS